MHHNTKRHRVLKGGATDEELKEMIKERKKRMKGVSPQIPQGKRETRKERKERKEREKKSKSSFVDKTLNLFNWKDKKGKALIIIGILMGALISIFLVLASIFIPVYCILILITFHYASKYERMRLYFRGTYSWTELLKNSLQGPYFIWLYGSEYGYGWLD